MLMTGKKQVKGKVKRTLIFRNNSITIKENLIEKTKIEVNHIGKFKSIHMASSGYNIIHNSHNKSKFVKWE